MDQVIFIDYGEDPISWVSAAEADEIDHCYAVEGDFVNVFGSFDDWTSDEISTSATLVVRPNQQAELNGVLPYADVRVRRALALAVDNQVLLDLGRTGRGSSPKTTTSRRCSRNTRPCRRSPRCGGRPGADGRGRDDGFRPRADVARLRDHPRHRGCLTAAQLRDAGFQVERIIIPPRPSGTTGTAIRSRSRSGPIGRWRCRPSRSPIARTRCGTRPASRTPSSTPSSPRR
jgi:peptide/nickel transport system substrate-binding protein